MPTAHTRNNPIYLILIILLIVQIFSTNCHSVEPEEFLQDSAQELRARYISKNIRCMVCQNQSIDESVAPLAKDLRILIRNKIVEGLTNEEIYDFLTDRYGDFILLKPPFKTSTYVLWFLPFLFFLIGIITIYWHNKQYNKKI